MTNNKTCEMSNKPHVIIISADTDDNCEWMSDTWFRAGVRHTKKAQKLFARASAAIEAATDVPDAVKRLEEAGFEVTRS